AQPERAYATECDVVSGARASRRDSSSPSSDTAPVASQGQCQPPIRLAIQATSGGPTNWPQADHCWTQPTVLEIVASLGATRTASENRVAGIIPPSIENSSTAT